MTEVALEYFFQVSRSKELPDEPSTNKSGSNQGVIHGKNPLRSSRSNKLHRANKREVEINHLAGLQVRSLQWRVTELHGQLEEKYFDYFVFNIVDCGVNCGLLRSGARSRAFAQTIGNARGLDINSPRSAEAHTQDLRFRRHQQRDNLNSARARQQLRLRSWL
jgi:hypothetical protein